MAKWWHPDPGVALLERFSDTEVLLTLTGRVGAAENYDPSFFELDPLDTDQVGVTVSNLGNPRGLQLLIGGFVGVATGMGVTINNGPHEFVVDGALSPPGNYNGYLAGANTTIPRVSSPHAGNAVDVWFDRPTPASHVNPGLFFLDPGTGETIGLSASQVTPFIVRITNAVDWPADVPDSSPWHVLNTDPDFFLLPPAILEPAGTISGTVD